MSEHDEQVSLFRMLAYCGIPEAKMVFAIPNVSYGGGMRNMLRGKKLKEEGRKAGVPDVFVAVGRGGYHGFFVEMKFGKNKPSKEQEHWLSSLEDHGYKTGVYYSAIEAYSAIIDYIKKEQNEKTYPHRKSEKNTKGS